VRDVRNPVLRFVEERSEVLAEFSGHNIGQGDALEHGAEGSSSSHPDILEMGSRTVIVGLLRAKASDFKEGSVKSAHDISKRDFLG